MAVVIPKVGHKYVVMHPRKGTFEGVVIARTKESFDVRITKGVARYLANEDRTVGDMLTIALGIATLKEIA